MNFLRPTFIFLALFLFLPVWSQQTTKEITLTREHYGKNGEMAYKETHLTGEKANRFRWQDHTEDYTNIRIYTEEKTKATDRYQQRKKVIPLQDGPVLRHIRRVLTTDGEGKKKEYILTEVNDLPEDLAVTERAFRQSALGQPARFAWLYISEQAGPKHDLLRLTWSGTGECPDEMGEENLHSGTYRVLLQDADWNTLMTREFKVTVITLPDDRTCRVIEVRAETYISSLR